LQVLRQNPAIQGLPPSGHCAAPRVRLGFAAGALHLPKGASLLGEDRGQEQGRKAKGFTQEQVAKGVGIGASTYCQYETGLRGVPADVANKIARFLDVEIGEIFLPTKFTISKH
jgi:putative transcriptional regulator